MARIRTVKPEFWSDPVVARLAPLTRLLFVALWNYADDAGRARAIGKEIAGFAFPFDDDIDGREVNAMLAELEQSGRILLYEVGGMRYYQVVNWHHQVINKPTTSRIPVHPDHSNAPVTNVRAECSSTTGTLPERCSRDQGAEDGRRKTEDGTEEVGIGKTEDGRRNVEEGPGETTAPIPVGSEMVSVPSVPSFGTGASSVPSVPEPAPQKPATPPPQRPACWHLSPADIKSLLKDGWTRQEIEWGVEIGIEDGTVPRVARSVLNGSILPEVREGKKPQRLTASAPALAGKPEPYVPPPMSPEAKAALEAEIEERKRIRREVIARNKQ